MASTWSFQELWSVNGTTELSCTGARRWVLLYPHTSQPLAVGLEGRHSQAHGEVGPIVQGVRCQQHLQQLRTNTPDCTRDPKRTIRLCYLPPDSLIRLEILPY